MPYEVAVVAPVAAGFEALRRIGRVLDPPLEMELDFGGACVVARDRMGTVVGVLHRPQRVAYAGDLPRCLGRDIPDGVEPFWWTEAMVPLTQGGRGLELLAAVAVATGGRMVVEGDPV